MIDAAVGAKMDCLLGPTICSQSGLLCLLRLGAAFQAEDIVQSPSKPPKTKCKIRTKKRLNVRVASGIEWRSASPIRPQAIGNCLGRGMRLGVHRSDKSQLIVNAEGGGLTRVPALQADERLLLEGQYEQARLQLEAARPKSAEEDDDVSEYIRSAVEVKCCDPRTSCDYNIVYHLLCFGNRGRCDSEDLKSRLVSGYSISPVTARSACPDRIRYRLC
jgi:hypothetical protein